MKRINTSHFGRSLSELGFALATCFSVAGCSVNTGMNNAGDNGASGDAVRFPTSGDRVIVSTSAQEGDLIVFGDQATAAVNRVRLSHPEFILDVHFDAAARPTSAILDGYTVEFTHHDDGTFDYVLFEDGAEIDSGNNLSPQDAATLSSVDRPAKALAAFQDSSLDLLLCAGERISRTAREECGRRGVTVSGDDFPLAAQLRADRQMVAGGMVRCAISRAADRLTQDASTHCDDCIRVSSACCDRVETTGAALFLVLLLVRQIMDDAAAAPFATHVEADLCRPADPAPSPDPPAPPPPSPAPVTDCADDGCFYCWIGTRYEGACPLAYNGDGTCDCGCQFVDTDCSTAGDEPPVDDDPGDVEPTPMAGMASAAVCPAGFTINVSGDHVPALREVVFHSYVEDTPYFAQCRYVRSDGVNPDRLLHLALWYRPPSVGTPHGACGSSEAGDIVTAASGCRERRSTRRTISALYCLSTPIVDSNAESATIAVLDELITNAVQAGAGAACP